MRLHRVDGADYGRWRDDFRVSHSFENQVRGYWPALARIAHNLGGEQTPIEAGWAIRDANWSPPDFQTVAEMLADRQHLLRWTA